MKDHSLNRLSVGLNIIWKFDLLRPDCYFFARLKTDGKGRIGFTSPSLRVRRDLNDLEIEKLNQLLKIVRLPVVMESFYDDVVYMIDPDIPCEIIVSAEDWRVAIRWSTGKEAHSNKLKSIVKLGRYMQKILPVESMGFNYPMYD